MTTDDGMWPDRDCLLGPTDWSELEHASTVAYSTCKFGPAVRQLEAAIQRGLFRAITSPPPALLRRMIATGRTAEGMPPRPTRGTRTLPIQKTEMRPSLIHRVIPVAGASTAAAAGDAG